MGDNEYLRIVLAGQCFVQNPTTAQASFVRQRKGAELTSGYASIASRSLGVTIWLIASRPPGTRSPLRYTARNRPVTSFDIAVGRLTQVEPVPKGRASIFVGAFTVKPAAARSALVASVEFRT